MAGGGAESWPDSVATPRLLLRAFGHEDVPDFVPLIGDWGGARWLARVPHPYGADDGREWVELAARNFAERAALNLLAVRTDDGAPIGGIGLQLDRGAPGRAEIGYWVGTRYHRVGYGLEMVTAMLVTGFGPLGLSRIWAVADPDNRPSQSLLLKAGFRRQGRHQYDFAARGRSLSAPYFEITAAEWPARREGSA
ncbi:8-oxo-dGTP diphosphatase [Azospirillum lipoferum]|uniref:GNAT family N-acetyltransferase n=1 Tax=Azospirillum lipoferum TaxID=193 RepID=A0A5A9GCX9_AZOLI|nr:MULTISPECIES: GNAT family N-acetyltransferase [Azospirillum]KAA0592246.1 GNAT family N-acetyltransferase [Azospirillum lipoferum]MCP1612266.1 8-oxo-dGTP diphosphatase [Azospirillum lipoferum]MDW5536512.1 GNAT family N-acetyltransferase [Azospirillum sp. NL1]